MPPTQEQLQDIEKRLSEQASRQAVQSEAHMSQWLNNLQSIQEPSTVLLTGFAPWKEFTINPSQQVMERLNGQTISGAQIIGLTLPVEFGEDTTRVFAAVRDFKPSLILSLGLAAGTTCLDIERFAINRRLSYQVDDQEVIVPEGPAAYFATIDVERIAQAIRVQAQIPAQAHGYAGSFLCNHIMYQTLHFAKRTPWHSRQALFIYHFRASKSSQKTDWASRRCHWKA